MKLTKSPSEFNTMSDTRRILYAVGILFFWLAVAGLYSIGQDQVARFIDQLSDNLVMGLGTSLRVIAVSSLFVLTVFHLATAIGMAAVLAGAGKRWSYDSVDKMTKVFNAVVMVLFGSTGAIAGGYLAQTHGFAPSSVTVLLHMVVMATITPLVARFIMTVLTKAPPRPDSYLTTLNLYSWIGAVMIVLPVGSITLDIVAGSVVLMSTMLRPLGYKFRCRQDNVGDNWEEHYFPVTDEPYAYR